MRVVAIILACTALSFCGCVRGSVESPELKPLPTLNQHTDSQPLEESHELNTESPVFMEIIPQVKNPENDGKSSSSDNGNEECTENILGEKAADFTKGDNARTYHSPSVAKAMARYENPPWSKHLTTVMEYLYFGKTNHDEFTDEKDGKSLVSDEEAALESKNSHQSELKANCSIRTETTNQTGLTQNRVILVNDSSLQTLLKQEKALNQSSQNHNDSNSTSTIAECQALLLFAPWCAFSAKIASHYNALSRLFPDLNVLAINAVTLNYWNARFGTVAVPNVLLFHNGKFIAKYNYTEKNIESLVWFIQNFTNLNISGEVKLQEEDFNGPVPTEQIYQTDYYLILAWTVIVSALAYGCYDFSAPIVRLCHHIINVFNYDHHHMD